MENLFVKEILDTDKLKDKYLRTADKIYWNEAVCEEDADVFFLIQNQSEFVDGLAVKCFFSALENLLKKENLTLCRLP